MMLQCMITTAFTTNYLGSVKCSRDDRRLMPNEVDGTYKNSKKYFDPLYA